jgi:hypothetical protein
VVAMVNPSSGASIPPANIRLSISSDGAVVLVSLVGLGSLAPLPLGIYSGILTWPTGSSAMRAVIQ